MALPSCDEFIDCLQKSGLVEEERLRLFLSEKAAMGADVAALGQVLVDAGMITPWQRDRLNEKKWKGFYLGKYRILRPIGAGAMGSVFLGEHKIMRHKVAIKVLAKRLVAKSSNVVRFEREARAAATVNHPNVVRAFDIDHDGDTHYLVMEFVQGENLQKFVQDQGVLLPKVAANYTAQIARGLHEAHQNGMVHRDIKPANVLLDETGVVKILDLGLARLEDEEASVTMQNGSRLLGTVDYLAPEQAINSHAIDGRADIYSLGCTLYFFLTGFPPFPSGSITERILKHQSKRPLDIRKRRPDVPEALVHICNRMMEKQAERRFQTAGEAADALEDFCNDRFNDEAFVENELTPDGEDGGLLSLAEDVGSGRSNASPSRSTTGKSSPSVSSSDAANSSAGRPGASKVGSGSSAGKSSAANYTSPGSKSTLGMKSEPNAEDLDLDLTPLESDSPKKSTSGSLAGKSLSGSMSGKSTSGGSQIAKKKVVAPEIAVEALASSSLLDLEMPPLEQVPSAGLAPLESQPKVTKSPATADLAVVTSIFDSPLGADPLSAWGPKSTSGEAAEHHAGLATPASQLLAQAKSQLENEEENSFNYPLWILIGSGLLISLILGVVGISYLNSFKKDELKATNREDQNSVSPYSVKSSRE